MTALDTGEFVTAVRMTVPAPEAGWSIDQITRRHGDFATVGTIALLHADKAGLCVGARIVLFGVATTPQRARAAEQALIGRPLDDDTLAEAAAAAFTDIDCVGDLHGSETYRREAGQALVRRSLRTAAGRTRQPQT
jgi:aerobic carbon-monoxide dehydrogenase medium subunit